MSEASDPEWATSLQMSESVLLRCLPVTSLDALLRDLPAVWMEGLNANAVAFAVPVEGSQQVRVSVQSLGEAQAAVDSSDVRLCSSAVKPLLASLVAADPVSPEPGGANVDPPSTLDCIEICCPDSDAVLGWVAWSGGASDTGRTLRVLPALSARLILQARLLGQSALTSEYESRLQRDRLEAIAEFAAGAGHEINNPLATIVGRAQLLMRKLDDPAARESLATIGAQAYRVRDMIGDAMLFARPPEPQLETLSVDEVIDEVIQSLAEKTSRGQVWIRFEARSAASCRADAEQFRTAVAAVLANAVEASSAGAEVRVLARKNDQYLQISVGSVTRLSDRERLHAFNPFFSGRSAGRGLGFGLSLAWRILTGHRGRIRFESSDEFPTELILEWPSA